uniref:ribosomal protein S4 n=1 Tax=Euplotes cristatus TaxID=756077 RepID=UPI002E75B7C4|nr:ribosomal protein S4 [Euplotes cristatus]UPM52074.1 ribosomal protein S4 [Euplotes cristatus]
MFVGRQLPPLFLISRWGFCLLSSFISFDWLFSQTVITTTSTAYRARPFSTPVTQLRFFVTRRYSFNSSLFFFLSRTSELPSFFSSRSFSLRYQVFSFRFRRFGLHLPSVLTSQRRVGALLSTTRLGRPTVRISARGRRTTRVFFFRRRMSSFADRVYNNAAVPRTTQRVLFFSNRPTRPTRLWSTSWFTSAPTRLGLNTVPFLFLAPLRGYLSFFGTNWVLEFRRKVTRFLRIDFKRTVIQYNLKPVLFRKAWLLGNRSILWNTTKLWRFSRLSYSKYRPALELLPLGKSVPTDSFVFRKQFLLRLRARRMPTVWASKITQRTLTPTRREFNYLYYKKPLRYQHRLTVLIARYYRFRVLEYLTLVEFSFVNVVLRSRFVVLRTIALSFIRRGWFLVNGTINTSEAFLVAPLDIIQLTPTTAWLVFYKWHLLRVREVFGRFFYYLRKWRVRARRPYPKQSSFRIPTWVCTRLYFRETTPVYFELDFLTLSCVNLINPLIHFNNFHFLSVNRTASATIRPLNWKSLT